MTDAAALLRPGVLGGVSTLIAGAPRSMAAARAGDSARESARAGAADPVATFATAADVGCAALGASVESVAVEHDAEALDAAVSAAVRDAGAIDLLVVDGAGLFAEVRARGGSAYTALRACLDGAWDATRATVNHAFLKAAAPRGRIVYVAPPPSAGEHAEAARAGLENLTRTLSIEWARHEITTVAIAPAADDGEACAEVAALVAYLASPAGAYFSGCQLDLRGARAA
jgi:NAD(P)-dependent dehydrogenase (short-subunit alcohol dehydrogenase family)